MKKNVIIPMGPKESGITHSKMDRKVKSISVRKGIGSTLTAHSKGSMELPKIRKPVITQREGHYPRVPLKNDIVRVCPVQFTASWEIDPKNPKPGIEMNLNRMLSLATNAAYGSLGAKLLVFPEFTLTGYNFSWTRDDWARIAIEVPDGEELLAVRKRAKELGVYIAFASHTKHKDWPGHFFNSSMIVNDNGELIHWHWKAYGIHAGPSAFEWATTVHDVLDEFVKRYGWDAVWPVVKTPIGNIATMTCSESFTPEHARMFALKGVEILCLCIGGGGLENDHGKIMRNFQSECITANCYGIFSNSHDGGSMIINPLGEILNQAMDRADTTHVKYNIPIASFRKVHKAPVVRTELIIPVYQQYVGPHPPNLYSDYGVPYDGKEAAKLATEHARWKR
ncbi:nitrilase-related carbon-nitrogen hydrolase [Chloroflexota bacterium]